MPMTTTTSTTNDDEDDADDDEDEDDDNDDIDSNVGQARTRKYHNCNAATCAALLILQRFFC